MFKLHWDASHLAERLFAHTLAVNTRWAACLSCFSRVVFDLESVQKNSNSNWCKTLSNGCCPADFFFLWKRVEQSIYSPSLKVRSAPAWALAESRTRFCLYLQTLTGAKVAVTELEYRLIFSCKTPLLSQRLAEDKKGRCCCYDFPTFWHMNQRAAAEETGLAGYE